jgi:hypothetical protein
MKCIYLPNEIWTNIYEYDTTYIVHFNICLQELNSHFNRNRTIGILKALFIMYMHYSKDHLFNDYIHYNSYFEKLDVYRYFLKFIKKTYYNVLVDINHNINYSRYCKNKNKKLYIKAY